MCRAEIETLPHLHIHWAICALMRFRAQLDMMNGMNTMMMMVTHYETHNHTQFQFQSESKSESESR